MSTPSNAFDIPTLLATPPFSPFHAHSVPGGPVKLGPHTMGSNGGVGIGAGGLNSRRANLPAGMRLNINRSSPTASNASLQETNSLRLDIPSTTRESPTHTTSSNEALTPSGNSTSPNAAFSSAISFLHSGAGVNGGLLSSSFTSSSYSSAQSPLSPHTPLPGTPLGYATGFGAGALNGGQSIGTGFISGPSSAGTGSAPWSSSSNGHGLSSSYGLGAMTPLPIPERRNSGGSGGFDFGFGSSFGAGNNGSGGKSGQNTFLMGRSRSKSGGASGSSFSSLGEVAMSTSSSSSTFGVPHPPIGTHVSAGDLRNEPLETPTAGLFGSIATMSIGGEGVNGNGKRLRDLEEDGEKDKEWVAEEEEILSSFLMNPLRPLTIPYPPSTLPPPRALDELTSQILHFHTPDEPSTSATVANRNGQSSFTNTHRRTRSSAGLVWKHTWLSTRKKLFDVARKESMGLEKEDRWKGRVVERSRGSGSIGIPFPMTPMENLMEIPRLEDVPEIEVMPPAIVRKAGHKREPSASSRMLASLASGSLLSNDVTSGTTNMDIYGVSRTHPPSLKEADEVEWTRDMMDSAVETGVGEDELAQESMAPKKGLGQVLRLSTSLQRSSKAGGSGSLGLLTGMSVPLRATLAQTRPSSLLQRGRSFTATDFENLSLGSSDKNDDGMEIEVELESSSEGSSETHGFITPRKPSAGSDVFSTSSPPAFGSSFLDSPSPSGSTFTDGGEDSPDEENALVTPHSKLSPPCIMLTQSSPSPTKDRSATPRQRDAPGSPSPSSKPFDSLGQTPGSLRRPKPPPLMRSLSTNSGNTIEPSAFSRFMGNSTTTKEVRPEVAFAAWRSHSDSFTATVVDARPEPLVSPTLVGPSAKRQKGPTGLSVILPPRRCPMLGADAENGGLKSPFIEDGGKKF